MNENGQNDLWKYLSFEQFSKVQDSKLRAEYIKKRNWTVKNIINPLYMYAIRHGYDDTNLLLTHNIHDMVCELKKFYDSKKIKRDGIEDIIKESIRKK